MSVPEGDIRSRSSLTGEADAGIDDLYRRYADWLRDLLRRRLRVQPAEIDDLVQDTYLRAARREDVAEIRHPKAFLSQTALNLFRDRRRREAVRAEHRREVAATRDPTLPSPDSLAEQEADLQLERLILALPEPYRDAFVLSRFGRMTNRQIAARLGIPLKTVEWRIGKAIDLCMTKLRD